jgi:hypothetical protein
MVLRSFGRGSPLNAPAAVIDRFTCSKCGGTFVKELPDEDALFELRSRFPDTPVEDCDVVCSRCYEQFLREYYGVE